jgi:hypothetical protein
MTDINVLGAECCTELLAILTALSLSHKSGTLSRTTP